MRLFFKLFTAAVFILLSHYSSASLPDIVNFGTKDYKEGHSINYCFAQDTNGVMYVGNAYGILEYDGQYWRKIGLDDGKSALSMDVDKDGRVYVGSSSEFGYLQRNEKGNNEYVSLKEKLPNEDIGEIMDLVCANNRVYLRGLHYICYLEGDTLKTLLQSGRDSLIYHLGWHNNRLRASQLGAGTIYIKEGSYSIDDDATIYSEVKEILDFKDGLTLYFAEEEIISSKNSADFKKMNSIFKNARITCALKISNTEFLVGTTSQGLFHLNTNGNLISRYGTDQGLADNFIHSLYLDRSGNVWMAYNKGLGVMKWNSPIRYITTASGISGLGLSSIIHQDVLYIGTSTGLYYMKDWSHGLATQQQFKRVHGISNNINYLAIQNGKLLACQQAEVYQIENFKAKLLSPGYWYGAWIWKSSDQKNEAFVGTYLGIARYMYSNNSWQFDNHIKGFTESARVFEIDNRGVLWAVQGNKGLYRVQLNEAKDSAVSVTHYNTLMGKNGEYFNDIFTYRDSILVTSYGATYYLNGDSLVSLNSFSQLGRKVNRIRKYKKDGLYAIYDDQAHILKNSTGSWEVENSSASFLRSHLVGSAEFFYEVADQRYLIGIEDGFALYSPVSDINTDTIPCLIRGVELLLSSDDTLLYSHKPFEEQVFDYENNNIRITYSIPLFGENNQISYETRLYKNGKAMHNWQMVNQVNFKEYTNLKEGNYVFWVRAKKGDSVAGATDFEFKVLPPWYRTSVAYIVYFLLGILTVIGVIQLFINQKKKLEAQNKRDLEVKEKLHHTEKLELELKNKENELAYMALTYTQKKDLLANLTSQLDKISKDMNHEDQIKFRSVKSAIANNLDDESNWENFQVHFDEKNDNFFQKLKEKEKGMNESYLLFCSYVRMGKPNKEIAELLNISVAAVEKRKYRLKKKWNLPDDTSFTEYLRTL